MSRDSKRLSERSNYGFMRMKTLIACMRCTITVYVPSLMSVLRITRRLSHVIPTKVGISYFYGVQYRNSLFYD